MKEKRIKCRSGWAVIFILLLIAPFNANAQTFGVRGGSTGSNLYSSSVKVSDSQVGYSIGAFGTYHFGSFSVSLDILYSRNRTVNLSPEFFYSLENDLSGGKYSVMKTAPVISSIEIPLLVNYIFYQTENMGVRLMAGPVCNLNLKSVSKNTYMYQEDNNTYYTVIDEGLGDKINFFEMGTAFGVGSDFTAGSLVYSVDLRYRIGLMDINNTESYTLVTEDLKLYGLSLLLGVAYQF